MDTQKIKTHWIENSDKDFKTMNHLFQTKDYHWALFVGHLVIEKLLKAYYMKKFCKHAPFIHELLMLTSKLNIELTETQEDFFDTVTTFNLEARYNDYKKKFYQKCTKEYTELWIKKITEQRKWLKNQFLKS